MKIHHECLLGLGYSHISYNIQLWGCSVNAHRIFLNQKRIIRLIFNLKCQESSKPYFIKYSILTVPCIFNLKCVTYVKASQTKFAKNYDSHKYPTRCGSLIKLSQHKQLCLKDRLSLSGQNYLITYLNRSERKTQYKFLSPV